MIDVTLGRPWLIADLGQPMRLLSWAPHRPGFTTARKVFWREVRNVDLTLEFDAVAWLANEMAARNEADSVGLLTSRNIGQMYLETAFSGLFWVACLAAVGLTNSERVGHRQKMDAMSHGTINLVAATDAPLSDIAMIEAISIAAQARTAAVITHGPDLPEGRATGTGTDCIVLACPGGDMPYAGLHTDAGEALGRAVYSAVSAGTREWMETGGA